MARLNRNTLIHIGIILLISLIPFIWVGDGSIILGHDAGTPINPTAHFLDRLQTWTSRYGLGANQTFATPGLFIHGLEYVLDQIGLSVSMGQGVSFFIYMFGMGMAMYYLARTLFPKSQHIALFAALIYQLNHFILQAWFIAERTKFTTYIALPILIAFVYTLARKKAHVIKYSIASAIALTVLNGGGFLPLFGAILVVVPLWMIVLIVISNNKRQLAMIYLRYILFTGLFSFLLNFYWLSPYISYVTSSFGEVTSAAGGIEGTISWLKSISLHSSYINAFRLQGIPEWYMNPNHPYAQTILYKKHYILGSYILPILAFLPLLIARKKRKLIAIIVLTALISIFFMAGSHAPFGWLYLLFIKYIPGFIAFRTAFYKFAPGLWLAYALLIGFALDYFIEKASRDIVKRALFVTFCVLIVAYTYPFLSTNFFNYDIKRKTLVKVPEYVHEYGEASARGDIPFNRILVLPPQPRVNPAEHTAWDYWSLASVTSLLDRKSYINRSVDLTEKERLIVYELYDKLDANSSEWQHLASRLGIDGILLREDSAPYMQSGTMIDSAFYKERLDAYGWKPVTSYGKWHLYPFNGISEDITLHTSFAVLKDYRHDLLFPDFGFDFSRILEDTDLIVEERIAGADPAMEKAEIILPSCEKCSFPARKLYNEPTNIIIFPGSQFYALKQQLELNSEPQDPSLKIALEHKTRQTLRRAFEIRRSIEHQVDRGDRISGLQYYKSQIDQLDTLVKQYLDSRPRNSANNEFLVQILDNVEQQLIELDSLSERITDAIEGEPFIALYQSVSKVYRMLDEATYKTESIEVKRFMFPITQKGTYHLWIDSSSVLTPSHASSEAAFRIKVDDSQHTNVISANQGWAEYAIMELNTGTHRLEVYESAPNLTQFDEIEDLSNIQLLNNNQLRIEPIKNEPCTILPIGTVPQDKYRLSFDLRSERFESKVSVFIDSDRIQDILLPKLTDTLQAVEIGSDHYESDFISNGISPTYLKVCQLFTQKRDTLIMSNLTLHRITTPKIALIRLNPQYLPKNAPTYKVTKKNNTSYEVEVDKHQGVLVALNQRYDTGWHLNDSHVRAQMYAQAWFVPESDSSESLNIEFTSQKDFDRGIVVSFISFILLIAGYTAYLVWERRSKRT